MTIWSILRRLQIFYGHLVYFVVSWYISPRFGILYQEKSGNPAGATATFYPEQLFFFVTDFQLHQSDQIGRIFASSANVYFAQCLENERCSDFFGLISWIPTIN
jgi:hypothetical protein